MRLLKTVSFLLLITSVAVARDTVSVNERFALGVSLAPECAFRQIAMTSQTVSNLNAYEYRVRSEVPSFSYTAGVSLSYLLKKQLSVSLGVNFSQKGFSTESIEATTVDHPEGGIGKVKYRYNYNYIEIPVKGQYIRGKKKVRLLVEAGLSPAFLLHKQAIKRYEYYNGEKLREKDKPNYINNTFNLFLNIGAGTDIALRENISLRILPTFNYGLLRTGTVRITEHLWNTGLTVSGFIRL
ncbi:MAG: PorT family protein [Bacteroidetes bacterium]|nr:PorT family protein [Bacteroidota bacterium]